MFVVYLDLVKAFDRVVRQLVFGWGGTPEHERLPLLLRLGLPERAAANIIDVISRKGPILEQWGAPRSAIELLRDKHSGSWCHIGDFPFAIEMEKGGKQGCKFGSIIFNCAYAVALEQLHNDCVSDGIVMHINTPDGPFWAKEPPALNTSTPVLEVAFVDDVGL